MLLLQDVPGSQWISAAIYDNTMIAKNIGYGGIDVQNTAGTTVLNNQIIGTGSFGVGIFDGTCAAVVANNVRAFTADPTLAQVVLDGNLIFGIPDTSDSTVFCKTHSDTVMNLGTNDQVIGCTESSGAVDVRRLRVQSGVKAHRKMPAHGINR
ncbi:MAG TPA: hypothetical protein VMX38_17140 [Verrucomicrobiae bacterium]|nr:hypothetical protein [Verrucomicrobiae bacterium]